jgi:hypothetical protein
VWVRQMLSAERYREFARECLEGAELATEDRVAAALFDMCRVWMEAALWAEGVLGFADEGNASWNIERPNSLQPS